MKNKFLITILGLCAISAQAQTTIATTKPYGKIDKADLLIKSCDFEKDANAMVLFSTADVYYDNGTLNQVEDVHVRIKIFNENGKNEANIRIPYTSIRRFEFITDLQAETINADSKGEPEITSLDKKVVYLESVDKFQSAIVFSFPNVRSGSVIEYKYRVNRNTFFLPAWNFQARIPVRYSEIKTAVPDFLYFSLQSHLRDPLTVNKSTLGNQSVVYHNLQENVGLKITTRAMANLKSMPEEPYMRSFADNLQSISFVLTGIKPIYDMMQTPPDSWEKIGGALIEDDDFGKQFKRKLTGEESLISKAKTLATDQDKIAYLFNEVKNNMKWNNRDGWYTNDGTSKAWDKKTGNATEINLCLYHLLKESGVKAYPMVVSTRENGVVNPGFTYINQFNRGVVIIPVDSTKVFVLDASDKYNSYTQIPDNLLGSTGFFVDKDEKKFSSIFLQNFNPATQLVSVNGDILADGSLNGTAQLSSFSYNRLKNIKRYKTDGEEKFKEYLSNSDKTLKIAALKLENIDTDSLPLVENIEFKKNLTGSDGNYIYFTPGMFIPLHANPFLSETRASDIDFGYRNNFSMVGVYKIPEGYKPETLPKNTVLEMPDGSIVFRRFTIQENNTMMTRYVVDFRKINYFKEDYASLHDFYKKMQELLNEQVALKKS